MENPKFKTVQEVVAAGEGLPKRYHYLPTDDSEGQPLNATVPEMEIPVIDLSLLLSSSDEGREQLSKLHSALSACGVVQVMNHGIKEALLDKIYELTKQFFGLSTEEKLKYEKDIDSFEGYGNDEILYDDQVLDWFDRLYLTTYPKDQRKLKFWPESPIGFRETLHEYTMKQRLVVEKFFKALARSLELEDNCFLEMCGENAKMETSFNLYPPCPRPEKVIGIKPHADSSAFTLLLPDKNVGGLQFLKDGKWYKAPLLSHTILINIGDMIEIMSNGIYKSSVHRVVANKEKERISVATFCNADADKEIEPVDGLVSEARPRLYKPIKDYDKVYFELYQQGRRSIEAALI
ncbi:Codeine O-demethylase [Cardamine amara subsp. amara]|uniref:Codeine O-demethylase n=1 Tax=Cardamine amara subsp. amara TaxID=228776 RepID=A0ABD1AIK2_CARAN